MLSYARGSTCKIALNLLLLLYLSKISQQFRVFSPADGIEQRSFVNNTLSDSRVIYIYIYIILYILYIIYIYIVYIYVYIYII
jgi:hypothetical protein